MLKAGVILAIKTIVAAEFFFFFGTSASYNLCLFPPYPKFFFCRCYHSASLFAMIYVSAQWSISALHIIIKQKKKAKLYAAMWIMGERASIYAKNTSFDVHRCIEHCFFFFLLVPIAHSFHLLTVFFVFVFIIVAFFFFSPDAN